MNRTHAHNPYTTILIILNTAFSHLIDTHQKSFTFFFCSTVDSNIFTTRIWYVAYDFQKAESVLLSPFNYRHIHRHTYIVNIFIVIYKLHETRRKKNLAKFCAFHIMANSVAIPSPHLVPLVKLKLKNGIH